MDAREGDYKYKSQYVGGSLVQPYICNPMYLHRNMIVPCVPRVSTANSGGAIAPQCDNVYSWASRQG